MKFNTLISGFAVVMVCEGAPSFGCGGVGSYLIPAPRPWLVPSPRPIVVESPPVTSVEKFKGPEQNVFVNVSPITTGGADQGQGEEETNNNQQQTVCPSICPQSCVAGSVWPFSCVPSLFGTTAC